MAVISSPQISVRGGIRAPFETEVFYLGEQAEKPVYHTSDPSRCRMNMVPHKIMMHDARGLAATSMEREGFMIVDQKLPDVDYEKSEEVDGPYLKTIQHLVQKALGADRVICDTPISRRPGQNAFQKPATRVHTDFSPGSARQLFEESWDQEKPKEAGLEETAALIRQSVDCPNAADRKYKRVMAVNVWRPLTKPPHDYPLAFVTRDTLPEADVRHADFIEEQKEGYTYFGELSLCEYNPNHQWYCFSEMTPDEVVLFVGYDFNRPGSTGVMHAAFPDPAWTKHNHGRASVEVRVFALWEN